MSQQPQQNYNDQSKGFQPSAQQQPSYDTGAVQYGAINPNVTTTTTGITPQQPTTQPTSYQPIPYYTPNAQQQGTYTANQPFYNAQPVIYTQPVTYQQPSYQPVTNTSTALLTNYDVKEENDAKVLLVVGLFVGIVWLICYFKYRRSTNPRAQAYARTSGILFFIQFLLSLALGIALSVSMSV